MGQFDRTLEQIRLYEQLVLQEISQSVQVGRRSMLAQSLKGKIYFKLSKYTDCIKILAQLEESKQFKQSGVNFKWAQRVIQYLGQAYFHVENFAASLLKLTKALQILHVIENQFNDKQRNFTLVSKYLF